MSRTSFHPTPRCLPVRPAAGLLGIALPLLAAGAAEAEASRTLVQTAAFEAASELRNILVTRRGGAGEDMPLGLAERLVFEGFDPRLGTLRAARLELSLEVEHGFSGLVGDGLPLDEASEPVAVSAVLLGRLEVIGPGGAVLASRDLASDRGGCEGTGFCAFSHAQRRPLALALDLEPASVSGARSVPVTVRFVTGTDAVGGICDRGGLWDRCHLLQARIGVSVPRDGIALRYDVVPAAGSARAGLAAPAALRPEHALAVAAALALGAGLALVARTFAHRHP